jgi:hypothetical protein
MKNKGVRNKIAGKKKGIRRYPKIIQIQTKQHFVKRNRGDFKTSSAYLSVTLKTNGNLSSNSLV